MLIGGKSFYCYFTCTRRLQIEFLTLIRTLTHGETHTQPYAYIYAYVRACERVSLSYSTYPLLSNIKLLVRTKVLACSYIHMHTPCSRASHVTCEFDISIYHTSFILLSCQQRTLKRPTCLDVLIQFTLAALLYKILFIASYYKKKLMSIMQVPIKKALLFVVILNLHFRK